MPGWAERERKRREKKRGDVASVTPVKTEWRDRMAKRQGGIAVAPEEKARSLAALDEIRKIDPSDGAIVGERALKPGGASVADIVRGRLLESGRTGTDEEVKSELSKMRKFFGKLQSPEERMAGELPIAGGRGFKPSSSKTHLRGRFEPEAKLRRMDDFDRTIFQPSRDIEEMDAPKWQKTFLQINHYLDMWDRLIATGEKAIGAPFGLAPESKKAYSEAGGLGIFKTTEDMGFWERFVRNPAAVGSFVSLGKQILTKVGRPLAKRTLARLVRSSDDDLGVLAQKTLDSLDIIERSGKKAQDKIAAFIGVDAAVKNGVISSKHARDVLDSAKIIDDDELRALDLFAPEGAKGGEFDPILGKGERRLLKQKQLHWDETAFTQRMEKDAKAAAKVQGLDFPEHEIPSEVYSQSVGTGGARATQALVREQANLNGQRMGDGAIEILRPVIQKGDLDRLKAYHLAKHTEQSVRVRGIETGLDYDTAASIVRKVEANPELRHIVRAQQGITKFLQNELKLFLKERGALPLYERFIKANPHYMPLKRFLRDMPPDLAKGGGLGALKQRRGGTRLVQDYMDQIRDYTFSMRQAALRARFERKLANLEPLVSDAWMKKIPGKQVPPVVRDLYNLEKQIRRTLDLPEGELLKPGVLEDYFDKTVDIWTGKRIKPTDEPVISIMRGEKQEFFRVHPEIFRELTFLAERDQNWFLRLSSAVVGMQKLGATGVKGSFALANFGARDLFTSWLVDPSGKAGFFPLHALRNIKGLARGSRSALGELFPSIRKTALGRRIVDDPIVQIYKSMGLDMSELLAQDKNLRLLVEKNIKIGPIKDIKNLILHPLDAARITLGPFESGARLAQIETILKSAGKKAKFGMKLDDALAFKVAKAASEVSVNFRRAGSLSRTINKISPFYNASIQGTRLTLKTMRDHPARTIVRGSQMAGLSLGLWWINKDDPDYQDLPSWRRLGFWNVKLPEEMWPTKGKWLSIPAPFEFGVIFKSAPEATANAFYNEDKEGFMSSEFGALAREAAQNFLPVDVEGDNLGEVAGSAARNVGIAGPLIDVATNRRWPNRPIIPRRKLDLPAESQTATYTSAVARTLASRKLLGQLGVAPAQIDHLIRGYSGGWLSDVIAAAESAAGHPLKKEALREAADQWIVGRFLPRRLASSAVVSEMWEEYTKLYARKRDFEQRRNDRDEGWQEYRLKPNEIQRFERLRQGVERFKSIMDRRDKAGTVQGAFALDMLAIEAARRAVRKK